MKNQTKTVAEKNMQELFITRDFDAPREMVFQAFTKPALMVQWIGPHGRTMKIDFLEMKSHGRYRFIHENSKGGEAIFNGVIHEVTVPERIIQTSEFEGFPVKGRACLEINTFLELPDNRTRVVIHDIFQSVGDRDAAVASGMEGGVVASYERLDEVLASSIR